MTKVQDVVQVIEQFAPPALAEDWDNVGLLVGNQSQTVNKVLVALDMDENVAKEAIDLQVDMIVTHHPMMFTPIHTVTTETADGRILLGLIRQNIALCSAHTNLDCAAGGLNDYLANLYQLQSVKPLLKCPADEALGLMRVGDLKQEMTVDNLAEEIARKLQCAPLSFTGDPKRLVRRVAVCSGSGGSFIKPEVAQNADVIITGDIKYAVAKEAEAMGLAIVVAGHYETEIFAMDIFAHILKDLGIEIIKSVKNKNIFN